mgnify:CR=1 FL=1
MADKIELRFQSQCFQWFHNTYGRFGHNGRMFRIKNELDSFGGSGLTRMKQLSENLATGIIPGVADAGLIVHEGMVWFEFKVGNNTQSEEQINWQKCVRKHGHLYFVVTTLEQFQKIINDLI